MITSHLYFIDNAELKDEFFSSDDKTNLYRFGPLSYINIVIGGNNSRKSRFLRHLLKQKAFLESKVNVNDLLLELKNTCATLKVNAKSHGFSATLNTNRSIKTLENYPEFLKHYQFLIKQDIRNFRIDTDLINQIEQGYYNYYALKRFDEKSRQFLEISYTYLYLFVSALSNGEHSQFIHLNYQVSPDIYTPLLKLLKVFKDDIFGLQNPSKVYIPTLRSAVTMFSGQADIRTRVNEDIYKSTVQRNYKLDSNEFEIFTGLDLYKKIKSDRNNIRQVRDRFTEFESFLQRNFFPNTTIDIIALEADNQYDEHIQIYIEGSGADRELHDLGDGIQALIVLLYPIFMAQENTWFFIEEPELNMHPGLLRIFFQTLLDDKIQQKRLKFFISTHSNHLLNLGLAQPKQISISSFQKEHGSQLTQVTTVLKPNTKVLDLLGVYNASVLMANCSIWVEGISDRRYLQAFLKAYSKVVSNLYQEDLHYCFFEYAGSNLYHYFFDVNVKNNNDEKEKIKAHLLANRIFLLADEDSSRAKKLRHNELHK